MNDLAALKAAADEAERRYRACDERFWKRNSLEADRLARAIVDYHMAVLYAYEAGELVPKERGQE